MLFDILRGEFGINTIISLMARIFVVFCILPIHEYAHAYVATRLGDQTARLSGRLTLNPIAHIDPIGAIMIVLVGFGYAKPVPVNPNNFKDKKKGMAITAAAGPISNLIMAVLFMLLSNSALAVNASLGGTNMTADIARLFFSFAARVNISLAVFNLLPIPPLDGSRIIGLIIPSKYYFQIMQYERYIIMAVFALIFFGVLDGPLEFLVGKVMWVVNWLAGLPFLLLR